MRSTLVRSNISRLWLCCLLAVGCAEGGAERKAEPKAVPVTVAEVAERDVPFEVPAFGTVEASSSVDIVPQVSGLVTEVHFKEGDFVRAGDLLFTVDTRPYAASMAVAKAELERNQALADQAKVDAVRKQKLAAEGLVSEQELDQARANEQSTAANVKLGQAALRSAGLNVQFSRITSPLSGRTGSLLVHAGNVVRAGEPSPLVVIRNLSPVQVRFAVPEEYVNRIRERAKTGPLTVRITTRGDGAKTVSAPLTFLENTVDSATGTLTLKATYANSALELWPGSAVEVALVLDIDRKATVVPGSAVQKGQDGAYAFVVEQGKAKLRRVEVERTTSSLALIKSGLRAGEKVVTDGQVRLRDGLGVSVKPAGGGTKPGASAQNTGGGSEAAL
ncbi:MAG TPA: efflux RND transporter periplasmic adaptor subunit [Polyangiaceae bacterium]